jgi:hypothetical protein
VGTCKAAAVAPLPGRELTGYHYASFTCKAVAVAHTSPPRTSSLAAAVAPQHELAVAHTGSKGAAEGAVLLGSGVRRVGSGSRGGSRGGSRRGAWADGRRVGQVLGSAGGRTGFSREEMEEAMRGEVAAGDGGVLGALGDALGFLGGR